MARLQDFQTVTPTASDKLLVVQSQGQGLVSYGSKLDSANPTGTGSLSLNRKSGTTVGSYSTAEGQNCEASGTWTHAEGYQTVASRGWAHAEGNVAKAQGTASHAEGIDTIANHRAQHVFGEYNVADDSTAQGDARGNYIEIVGKGTGNTARSNARTLDWSGNEVLAGDLTINGNQSLSAILARIVNPPDLSNITSESLENGTVTSFTSTGKWYCVRTINTSTSGGCASYLLNNSEQYLSVGTSPQGNYVRAMTSWLYFPSGFKFKARSIFATSGATGELLSASPLSI